MIGQSTASEKLSGRQGSPDLLARVKKQLAKTACEGTIERVDISKHGELEVQLASGGSRKWLALGDGRAEELNICDDHRIPLSGRLRDQDPEFPVSVLAYRPARRLVIHEVRDTGSVVIKGYRKGRGGAAAAKYRLAVEALEHSPITAARPAESSSLRDCVELPFLPGERVQVTKNRAHDFISLGYGIHDLQQFEADEFQLSGFSRDDELAVLDDRVRRLRLVNCDLPEAWDRLRQDIEQAAAFLPLAGLVTSHRDLHDGQLLLTGAGLALFDFDLMCRAEPELDPANFLAHLALRGLQHHDTISEQDIYICGKKFLEGVNAFEREGFWERLRFYQATSFARLALVYSLRPNWTSIVPGLVKFGHRCLDELRHLSS